jgi:iron complex transport system substrate-binding protein
MARYRGGAHPPGGAPVKRLLAFLLLVPPDVSFAGAAKRIVSIGGAQTEIIYALGAESRIVGVDSTSYWPETAKLLPQVGYQRALSAEGILSLEPDLVILGVDAGPPAVIEQLKQANIPLLVLQEDHSIASVKQKIAAIARALGEVTKGKALMERLDEQQAALDQELKAHPAPARVLFIMQHGAGSAMVAGTHTAADAILKLAGASNAVTAYEGYKPLTPEAAPALAPDIILVTTQTLDEIGGKDSVLKLPGLALTPAGKSGRVIAMDTLLLLGFGPRTIEAARELHAHRMEKK